MRLAACPDDPKAPGINADEPKRGDAPEIGGEDEGLESGAPVDAGTVGRDA